MEAKDFIALQIKSAHSLMNSAIENTPQEMVNRKVGDDANTIAAAYAHTIGAEDYFIQTAIFGKPRLWESVWQAKLGITAQIGRDWAVNIPDLAAFREYAAAVMTAAEAYVETLTPAELDREVAVFGNMRPVSRVLVSISTHGCGHAGEIAGLKGAMGVKGLPF
ncbi:MAG: DinB family protein [Chloroflexi bacterium]|nr:DinB family protein [Chloroflexota bacterium]